MNKFDTPKPNITCPECGNKEFFWHCVRRNIGDYPLDYVICWGNVVTCLKCKSPWGITKGGKLI